MAPLTYKARKRLPKSDFVFPGQRRYPIYNLAHARNALARSSGKPEEAAVRAAVRKQYPGIEQARRSLKKMRGEEDDE